MERAVICCKVPFHGQYRPWGKENVQCWKTVMKGRDHKASRANMLPLQYLYVYMICCHV
jgi:hypothetical protein